MLTRKVQNAPATKIIIKKKGLGKEAAFFLPALRVISFKLRAENRIKDTVQRFCSSTWGTKRCTT